MENSLKIAIYVLAILLIVGFYLAQFYYRMNRKSEEKIRALEMKWQELFIHKFKEIQKGVNKKNQSILKMNRAEELIREICKYMTEERPYLDPDFNMNKLCEALNVNRTYLSLVINKMSGMRFETFVNSYRIAEALNLLSMKESVQYTLEYCASEVGFQSKSTFNRSFKYFTDTNPSDFQRKIMPDQSACQFFISVFNTKRSQMLQHFDFQGEVK